MKKRLVKITLIFVGLFSILAYISLLWIEKNVANSEAENAMVLLNEIEQLTTDAEGYNPAGNEIEVLQTHLRKQSTEMQKNNIRQVAVFYFSFTVVCLLMVFGYLYFEIMRPFSKLERYAERVAKGDLDFSLEYERANFFGAFTWAFDHMRKEIIAARKNEMRAISENKTIIATLSHDIKTPIASIRAYAEGLEANIEADYEQRQRYLQVIMKKCDDVSRLVNDLVLHSLSELERLEIKEQKIAMRKVLEETLQDLEFSYVSLKEPIPDAQLPADEKRLAQVLLNLLENAKKYAPDTPIDIWALQEEERYEIHIRDYGSGILPEDMPFVLQKFYRGKNVGDKPGSGLGLYIVSYIMERMKGGIILKNHTDGLEVILWLPLEDTN